MNPCFHASHLLMDLNQSGFINCAGFGFMDLYGLVPVHMHRIRPEFEFVRLMESQWLCLLSSNALSQRPWSRFQGSIWVVSLDHWNVWCFVLGGWPRCQATYGFHSECSKWCLWSWTFSHLNAFAHQICLLYTLSFLIAFSNLHFDFPLPHLPSSTVFHILLSKHLSSFHVALPSPSPLSHHLQMIPYTSNDTDVLISDLIHFSHFHSILTMLN